MIVKSGGSSHESVLCVHAAVLPAKESRRKSLAKDGRNASPGTPSLLHQSRKLLPERTRLALLALTPLAFISGCSGLVSANATKAPPPSQASIQVTPGSLNFGNVVVGQKVSLSASVANTGNTAVIISSATVTSGPYSVTGLSTPLSLPVGQSSAFQVWFDPTAAGTATGTMTLQTSTGVLSGSVALTGAATAPQQITLSTSSLNLGSTTVGSTTKGTLTITNSGGANLALSLISVSGTPFGISGIATPSTIAPGGNAILNVSFAPTAAGTDSGSITIMSNDPQDPTAIITLSGTATSAPVAPTITTQPANQTVTAGQTATFTVAAGGTAPLSYQWQENGANIVGAISANYTTPATTTADNSLTFRAVVSNTAGTVTSAAATLTVNSAPAPAIQLNSNSINFGNNVVGTTTSQALIITNTGTATLSITQINESGSAFNLSGFSLPLGVNAGQQATVTVGFVPTSVGTASGSISIVSNASSSPTSVNLSGTGIAATLALGINPTSLSFGNVTTGSSSAPQNVTITNTGNANIMISQLTVSGTGYSFNGGSAPVTLSPTQNLVLSVQFSPAVAGSVNGSLSIVSNASGSPAAVNLSATGVAPVQHSVALNWNASASTVTGYNVYRSTISGTGYTQINSSLVGGLSYTDSSVQNATTYYYVATAVDASGNESVYSNEVSAPIP